MELSYHHQQLHQHADRETLILQNARGWRVEMQLRRNEDDSHTLIAMSGLSDKPAELSKLQGPYQTRDQGIAARAAIAIQLLRKEFQLHPEQHSIWSVQAQKAIQKVRSQRIASQGNYDFHPDDVL